MASKRLAVTKAELEDVNLAVKMESAYLGISGSDLKRYGTQLEEKAQLLKQIAELQVQHLKPAVPPPGPAMTFDRCSLPKVVQHLLDYEAVATESSKALRALASLAYNDVQEVAAHRKAMAQLLRVAKLHPDEDAVQLAAMKCLCHLAFVQDIACRELADRDVLDVLMAARMSSTLAADVRKIADEATARIISAESSSKSGAHGALLHIFRAEAQARGKGIPTTLRDILKLLSEELVDGGFLADRFIEAAPSGEDAVGWLSLLVDLIGQNPALVCPAAASTTATLMDAFPRSLPIQKSGLAVFFALAARGGAIMVAEAQGTKRVESAQSGIGLEDAELQADCINFLVPRSDEPRRVLVLDWPLDIQKLCDIDYSRVVSVTKEAMQRHLDVVSLQVTALSALAKIVEVLSMAKEMKAGGLEGFIKAVLARHKDQKPVWTWGRILLDNLGLDRNWTLREQ